MIYTVNKYSLDKGNQREHWSDKGHKKCIHIFGGETVCKATIRKTKDEIGQYYDIS